MEYEIKKGKPEVIPHGNTKRGLPFHRMEIGDYFEVPPEDFPRTSCARSHFHKKMKEQKMGVKIISRAVRDPVSGKIVSHQFKRIK